MTKDEALKKAFKQAFQLGQDYWYQADHEYESQNKKSDVTRAKFEQLMEDAIKEALAQDALDRKAENARELGLDYEPVIDKSAAVRIATALGWTPQRTWVGLTPSCPKGLIEYHCDIEGVDVVCFLEYTPEEEGSRDSYGLLNEPGTSENLELVNAYVKGTDVDIGHLLLQYLVDHITTTALEDFKNDDY